MEFGVGSVLEGKVTGITKFGAFVSLPEGKSGLVHISEIAYSYVNDVKDHLKEGQEVKVKVIEIDYRGKISLDRLEKPEAPAGAGRGEGEGRGERRERGDRPGRGARDTGARGFDRPARRERGDRPRRPGDNGGRAPRRHHEAE